MLYDAQSLYLYSQKYLHVLKENCTYRNLFLQFVIGSTIRGWRLMYAELKTIPVCLLIHIYQFINVSNLIQKNPKQKISLAVFLLSQTVKCWLTLGVSRQQWAEQSFWLYLWRPGCLFHLRHWAPAPSACTVLDWKQRHESNMSRNSAKKKGERSTKV